jgi:flagellar hook-basal body complex protein FliE
VETLKIMGSEMSRILPNTGLPSPGAVGETGAAGLPGAARPVEAPFQELLKQAVTNANETAQKSEQLTGDLVQGKPVDLHRVMLAQQEAQISFEIVLQMRDKLVSAYQEISRMPL